MTPARGRSLAVAAVVALGCTPFEGRARDAGLDVGGPRDTSAGEIAGDVPDAATDAAVVSCGLRSVACDPVLDRGCGAGTRCGVDGFAPLRLSCAPVGMVGLGAVCGGEAECAVGLHCFAERCLPLCCSLDGEGGCAASAGAGSHCTVTTDTPALSVCTLPGDCDYRAPDFRGACTEGFGCFPTSTVGESRCLRLGGARLGEGCTQPNDCLLGLGCAGPTASRGTCRRLCRLGLRTECAAGTTCQPFLGRPSDWGACS